MEEVEKFLKECKTYFIGTIDGDKPRVRPFGTVNIFENKLYIQTGKSKNVSKQIEKNNNVEICGYKGDRWIRISGKLVRDDRVEAKEDMLNHYPELRGMYNPLDDNTEVLYFKDAVATIYSFTEEPKVIEF